MFKQTSVAFVALLSCNMTMAAQGAAAEPAAADQLRLRQAAEARTFCTDNKEGPGSGGYGNCVNTYLQSHYGWQVVERPDGSLGVGIPTHGIPQYY
jgi:hypothetical protein